MSHVSRPDPVGDNDLDKIEVVRLSMNLHPDAAKSLKDIAKADRTSITEIVRRALAVFEFVRDAQRRGAVVQVVEPNGETTRYALYT